MRRSASKQCRSCSADSNSIWRETAIEGGLAEVAQGEVDLDRLTDVREVARAPHDLEFTAAETGERAAVAQRRDAVAIAVDHEHRAAQRLCGGT